MSLKEKTMSLHRICERHPVGQLLSNGTVGELEWASWLEVQRRVHEAIDPMLPGELHREQALAADLATMDTEPLPNTMADAYVATLRSQDGAEGACYVIVGAHLMGGSLIAQRVGDRLPHGHVPKGEERKTMLRAWEPLRERDDLEIEAMRCFGALLSAMEELRQRLEVGA